MDLPELGGDIDSVERSHGSIIGPRTRYDESTHRRCPVIKIGLSRKGSARYFRAWGPKAGQTTARGWGPPMFSPPAAAEVPAGSR